MNGFRFGASETIAPTLRSRFGPAVQALADARREGVVDGRVAKAHWMPIDLTLPSGLAKAVTPTTAFSLSSARVVAGSSRSTLPAVSCFFNAVGQRVGIHLEADGERGLRADAGSDAAVLLSGDRLVQLSASPQKASLPNVS